MARVNNYIVKIFPFVDPAEYSKRVFLQRLQKYFDLCRIKTYLETNTNKFD